MAEASGRMNGSWCFPPPALCPRFPSLQACPEELPLVLQRPDSFPLVMGILQEINLEKVGCPNGVDNTFLVSQRPHDQQVQTLGLSEVKLENSDLDENHQYSYETNAELCQEWSLKGVEEMLADSEELQLRHDIHQQAHAAAENFELASTQDVKPLLGFQSTQFEFWKVASDEVELLVDEKPPPCSRLLSSLREQVPSQGRASLVEEPLEVKPSLLELHAATSANDRCHHQSWQAFAEERMGLDILKVVKREPSGIASHGSASIMSDSALEVKENTGCIAWQIKSRIASNADTELHKSNKTTVLTHDIQVRKCHSCESVESNLETQSEKKQILHDIERSTSAILALPAEFTEQEKSQAPQCSSAHSVAGEGPKDIPVSSEGQGGVMLQADFLEAGLDICAPTTLRLASSQPQTGGLCPTNLERVDFPDEKPVATAASVQDEHDAQCQRTNPNQWQHVTTREHNAPLSSTEPLWPLTDGPKCYTDGGTSAKVARNLSKSFNLQGSSSEAAPEKQLLFKKGRRSSGAGKHIKIRKLCSDGGVSCQTVQLMPHGTEDESSALDAEEEGLCSENDQLTGPNQKRVKDSSNMQSCHSILQSAQASELNEPHKKRMRGTLPKEEEGDGAQKEKDTRCHRSDGKHWRCARECINGAYYCQYHLRARRIGYNRRKHGLNDTHHLEAASKTPLKVSKESRRHPVSSKRSGKL